MLWSWTSQSAYKDWSVGMAGAKDYPGQDDLKKRPNEPQKLRIWVIVICCWTHCMPGTVPIVPYGSFHLILSTSLWRWYSDSQAMGHNWSKFWSLISQFSLHLEGTWPSSVQKVCCKRFWEKIYSPRKRGQMWHFPLPCFSCLEFRCDGWSCGSSFVKTLVRTLLSCWIKIYSWPPPEFLCKKNECLLI